MTDEKRKFRLKTVPFDKEQLFGSDYGITRDASGNYVSGDLTNIELFVVENNNVNSIYRLLREISNIDEMAKDFNTKPILGEVKHLAYLQEITEKKGE